VNGFNKHEPSSTPLGEPNEKILLGYLDLNKEEFLEIIQQQIEEGSYFFGDYNLFTHNCNCFSNDLAMRLFDKQIPAYIREMPLEAVTDLMRKPVIGKLFKSIYAKLTQSNEQNNMHSSLLEINNDHDDENDNTLLLNIIKEHLDSKQIRYSVADE